MAEIRPEQKYHSQPRHFWETSWWLPSQLVDLVWLHKVSIQNFSFLSICRIVLTTFSGVGGWCGLFEINSNSALKLELKLELAGAELGKKNDNTTTSHEQHDKNDNKTMPQQYHSNNNTTKSQQQQKSNTTTHNNKTTTQQ